MNSASLAWRSMARQPARAALGIAGVAIVGALLFDMLMLSRGLVVSFRQLLDATGFDVRVTAAGGIPGMGGPPIEDATAVARQLRALPEVVDVVPLSIEAASVEPRAGSVHSLELIGAGAPVRSNWDVIEGQDLFEDAGSAPGVPPILIDPGLARRFDLAPGAVVLLRGKCADRRLAAPAREHRVAGVARFRFASADRAVAAVRLPDLRRLCGASERDAADFLLALSDRSAGTTAAVAAIRRERPDLAAWANAEIVARFARTDFSYFRQISFALTVITLFFAFLLVATLLTVSTNQRLAQVAALRALGLSRRRVVADLLWESGMFVGAGGVLAVPAGLLLSSALEALLGSIPGIPREMRFFVLEPRALVLHAGLLAATGLLSAAYPVALVARVPIAATLRRETLS